MALLDVLSLLKQVLEFGFTINGALEKAGHNRDDCRVTGDLLRRLGAMAERLRAGPAATADASVRDATAGLEQALRRASDLVAECRRKNFVIQAFEAADIADNLHRVSLRVFLNLGEVLFAYGIYSRDEMKEDFAELRAEMKEGFAQIRAEMKEGFAQFCTDGARNKSIDVHLPEEVAELVQDYRHESTESASSQDRNKRETEKADMASSQDRNKRETEKTDVGSRPEVKIPKSNRLGSRKVAPDDASLLYGLAEPASVESVTRQHGSSITIKKIISRSIENMPLVTSMDVHPSKTWIVTGHEAGNFSIWEYQEQKTVMELQVNKAPGKAACVWHEFSQYFRESSASHSICSAKFIAQKEWLVVGDGDGYIHIYDYNNIKLVEKFRAHHKSVDSLAVHPTEPYLLSSSAFGGKIRLWNWSKNWVQIQRYDPKSTYPEGVRSLKFNPRDTNTFACVLDDNTVKVGNIKTSSLETILEGQSNADYFFSHGHQQLMVTLRFTSPDAEIWDLETGKVVHTLRVSGRKMNHIAFNPKLEKLVTTLDDGTVCLWDANTYRREEMVNIMDSKPCGLIFITGANGSTRLVVRSDTTIEIMEVNLPIANTSKQAGSGNYG